MKSEWMALARYRFSRARETFQDGIALVDQGSLNSAVNRFYYAAFYAARALLATKGVDSSRHSGVISLFSQHFVKRGIVSSEVAKTLPRSFEKRLDTDYEDFTTVDQREIKQLQRDIRQFIHCCEQAFTRLAGRQRTKTARSSAPPKP